MKKLSVCLTLILCLVLCVFAFASCGKKTPETTEEASGSTGHVHVPAAEYTIDRKPSCSFAGSKSLHCTECQQIIPETVVMIDPLPHVEEANYTVITPATCKDVGWEIKYCQECGLSIDSTIHEIPVDNTKHVVKNWSATPTLLNPEVHRTGDCTVCNNRVEEDAVFKHDVKILDTTSGKYSKNYATLGEIRGSEHFYATDEHPNGNDLLVEYSFLWNESLLNLYNSGSAMPAIDTRFVPNQNGSNGNMGIVRLELATGTESKWCICKFGGGFTAYGSPEADSPYPRFETTIDDATAYPNIGGANEGDGKPLGETQWGWHRISIRFREELTNEAAVKGGAEATYYIQLWVYIDGILVFHNSGTDHRWGTDGSDRKLYSAASDGAGGITYTENDDLYLHGAFLDSTKMKDGKGYVEVADYSARIGSEFVQKVKKATNPTPATLTVEEGVSIPATIWYELAD